MPMLDLRLREFLDQVASEATTPASGSLAALVTAASAGLLAKVARSSGDYAEILAKDGGYVDIKLPSSEVRKVPANAWASIGEVSNNENRLVNLGKAGRSRWLGIRPTTRGTAMNPVDHPHGGGEGRQGRGRRRAISIYGKPTGKGQKSRRAKKYSNKFIVRRRKVGKK